jgi:hypothetical protein
MTVAPYLTSGPDDTDDGNWQLDRSRVLICGEPDTGKTTSFRTWDKPLHIVVMPGELGSASLPRGPGIWHHRLPRPEDGKPRAYGAEWTHVMTMCRDIVSGRHGQVATIAIDGLHKLYELALAAVTNGLSAGATDFEARKYLPAWNVFKQFLDMVNNSSVPNVVMTCWIRYGKEDPTDRGKDAAQEQIPALAGQQAQKLLGEFSVKLVSVDEGAGAGRQFKWVTQPTAKIRAAGIKGPLDVTAKIPPRVPQDWQAMKPLLGL